MLRATLAFSLSRRPIILLCLLVFMMAGFIAYTKLNIEAYPNPAPVILEITAQAPGLSAEEMERYYTIPMEVGLAATPGVDVIRSISFYGLSFVRVSFQYGIDYYFAFQMANLSLQQNVTLPDNVRAEIQASSLAGEILRYQVIGPPGFGLTNLRTIQDWVLQRRLLTVPGVAQVVAWGGTTKEYEVDVDLRKLEAYGILLPQLATAIGNANGNVGGRTLNVGQQSINIRGLGLIDSGGDQDLTKGWHVDDIKSIVLSQTGGMPVLVQDVAHVYVGNTPRLGKAGRDKDDDVVTAIVNMNRTMPTNDVMPRLKTELEKINTDGTLPPGVKVETFYDRTWLVNITTHTVLHNLIFGCLLVFFIQWIFLGNLRSAIIVGANIPFALFFSMIILVLRGESANLLSIGAVDFGIIVDSAVILVENIFRNFEVKNTLKTKGAKLASSGHKGADDPHEGWTDRIRSIYLSALQVDKAIFFSTAITIAAFAPLFTMQGVEGQIFGPMARTYGYALLGALIATFTITPVLASLLLPEHVGETETKFVQKLRTLYRPILSWAIERQKAVAMGGLAFLVFSGLLLTQLGNEFLPTLEEGNLWIRATLPPTISLEAGMPTVTKIREILLRHPEVITVVSQHGRPDDGSDDAGFNNVELFVPLKPMDKWPSGMTKGKLIVALQKEFAAEFVGVDFNFSQYIQDNIEEGLSGIKGSNSVKIIGPNLEILEEIGSKVLHEMEPIKGVKDLGIFRVFGQPNLNIKVDRAKAARYGINAGDINIVVEAALAGKQATMVLEGDRKFPLTVRLAPEYRDNMDAVRDIKVGYQTPANVNAYIPLKEIATISLDTGASYIYHERNERFIPIKFSVRDRDLGSTVAEAQAVIAKNIKLPQGYRMEWAGEFQELGLARERLSIIVPLSLLLILGLLYGLFNSLKDSLLVLAGIPFSVAGGIVALYVTGMNFSISAAVGFISLFGVSVMNGILLMTYFNQLKLNNGMNPAEAMQNAAEQRMRPMLMTALSACIGLLPAALSTGIGSQVQRPLATVVVGGMLLGPIMMLVVVPALKLLFLGKKYEPAQT